MYMWVLFALSSPWYIIQSETFLFALRELLTCVLKDWSEAGGCRPHSLLLLWLRLLLLRWWRRRQRLLLLLLWLLVCLLWGALTSCPHRDLGLPCWEALEGRL